jgi:hypothetical protein
MRGGLAGSALLVVMVLAALHAGSAELVPAAEPVFAGRGVIVLWAILRAADKDPGVVVLRVLPEDPALGAYAADLADRAGQTRMAVAAPALLSGWDELRVDRERFAERPRLELHFASRLEDLLARPPQPAFTLFFARIPESTPAVSTEAALAAYFAGAVNRARARRPAR